MLGDRPVRRTRNVGDRDPARRRVGHGYILDAGAGNADHAQVRRTIENGLGKLGEGRPERQDDIGAANTLDQLGIARGPLLVKRD